MIKAPFNFVPLSDHVYFPDWSNQISQDIPFSDGISGTIELKITAESPIFVRNGHTRSDADAKNECYRSFSKADDGRYFIPGTSIKGAVRNVLEIMSFGKLHLDENAMFAQREWDNEKLYPLKKQQQSFHCGFLRRHGYTYEIEDCGKPYRIGHDRLDEYLGDKVFARYFSQDSGFDLKKEQELDGVKYDPKTAAFKYALIGKTKLDNLSFDYDEEHCNEYKDNRLLYSFDGSIKGTIVLTGQPDQWIYPRPKTLTKNAGKFYDFVFVNPKEGALKYTISESIFNHFKFIYADSADWKRAKSELEGKGIPVFFRVDKDVIRDFGMAYLYKLPYDKSPFDTLPPKHKEKKSDLAECMFGYTRGTDALRGRIQFSNAFSDNAEVDSESRIALGSPKASYYPIYIKQEGNNGKTGEYLTYNNSIISGWKRYYVRKNIRKNIEEIATGNDKIDTLFFPLKKNAIFSSKVIFHNLRPIELGALLSALTFHHTEGCYHQLGQAKSFGYGKTSFSVSLKLDKPNFEGDYLMALFEQQMIKGVGDWRNHYSIKELFTLAHQQVEPDDILYQYLKMSNTPSKNEFLSVKNLKEFLQEFSDLSNYSFIPKSHLEILAIKQEEEKKKNEQDQEKEQQRRKDFDSLAQEAGDAYNKGKYQLALEKYKSAETYGYDSFQARIKDCQNIISHSIDNTSAIEDFLSQFRVASITAFAGRLKKRSSIAENDIFAISNKLKNEISSLKKAEQKKWYDFKNWSPIIDVVGVNFAKKIFGNLEK